MSRKILDDFSDWLLERWRGAFSHSYQITSSRHWKKLREAEQTVLWECKSLRDALLKYSWNGLGYRENSIELASLATALRRAIMKDDNAEALKVCESVLRWGGVYRQPSVDWLQKQARSSSLCRTLTAGIDALRTGNARAFDGEILLMNSGFTKIFSLASEEDDLIIYDGRVGAALGLLVRIFCEERNLREVPNDLLFRWGVSRDAKHNRNPSSGIYVFPRLGSAARKNEVHAEMVINSSRLLQVLSKKSSSTVRDWEAALFMIGYEIPSGSDS